MKYPVPGLLVRAFFWLLPQTAFQAQEIRFYSNDTLNPGNGLVEVSGMTAQQLQEWSVNKPDWRQVLRVFPNELRLEKKETIPPMLGTYVMKDSVLQFIPRFPFREGLSYVVEFAGQKTAHFTVPYPKAQPATFVEAVYPGIEKVPANLLKMYVHFSGPMGIGDVYEYLYLLDENGLRLEKPFLELEPALWDKNHTRLTLWFDPGRIKTGLQPNLALGQPLQAGKSYTLLVSKHLRDAFGQELAQDFEKKMYTVAEDREKPNPADWIVSPPAAQTLEPLVVHFPEALDKVTLENGMRVTERPEQLVAGSGRISKSETAWIFTPERPWLPGDYRLDIDPRLEDLAGNNLMRLFDTPVQESSPETGVQEVLVIRFHIHDNK